MSWRSTKFLVFVQPHNWRHAAETFHWKLIYTYFVLIESHTTSCGFLFVCCMPRKVQDIWQARCVKRVRGCEKTYRNYLRLSKIQTKGSLNKAASLNRITLTSSWTPLDIYKSNCIMRIFYKPSYFWRVRMRKGTSRFVMSVQMSSPMFARLRGAFRLPLDRSAKKFQFG